MDWASSRAVVLGAPYRLDPLAMALPLDLLNGVVEILRHGQVVAGPRLINRIKRRRADARPLEDLRPVLIMKREGQAIRIITVVVRGHQRFPRHPAAILN